MRTDPLHALAQEAVLHTYPLYEMRCMRAATSPRHTCVGGEAPKAKRWCNVFTHRYRQPDPSKSSALPANNTFFLHAWLDLRGGPLVIDVPDLGAHSYLLWLLDFYMNPFARLGPRLASPSARSFLVTPPGWRRQLMLPAPLNAPDAHIAAPTPWLWAIGGVLVEGRASMPAVQALQEGFIVRPLPDWLMHEPPRPRLFDPACDPAEPVTAMHFATQVNAALRDNPPPGHEAALLARFAAAGIGPGLDAPNNRQRRALQRALGIVLPGLRGAATRCADDAR